MPETLSIETFAPLLDDDFRVPLDPHPALELRLAEVAGTGDPARPDGRVPFSLLFRGPAAPILPQRIYRLEHARLGALDLFLVPLEPDAAGARYEAIFN
jgi:hypothetical protein